jgi:hypothetical protein
MSSVSQGKLVGSKGAMFRQTSTSKPDELGDTSGKDVGASRNFAHEKAAVDKAAASKAKKEQDIINRTKAAAQRAKETLRMAKEEISEAKKFVYDKPQSHLVKLYDKKPTADLHGMHQRWSGDHQDKKSSPSRSEDLLAVHHVLKSRGQNPAELPQHKNLGMMRMHEETGTEARVKIKNVARPDDAEPTSEKSKLSKQAEIKTKIIEERPTMSKIDFGLSSSLINATKSIMEKKHAKEAKTDVDLDPETNDKLDDENGDNDDDVKKESKHTTPKSAKEKKLAALAHPKDKITHKDVLVGRGVLKKEETEIEEAIKPYVSYSGPRPGKSPSATVMAAGEKPHKTFSKDEHGADYKQKAMDYFKKNMKKLHSEEVEEIDELEKKTLGSYITKVASLSPEKVKPSREAGIEKAAKKYKMKEEVDIDSLTEEQLEEVLKKSDPAGKWIRDFVHSKDPRFAGKSKKERMKQALGAYYAKQRNEEVEGVDESKWDYPKSMTRPRIDSYLGKTGQDERAARKAWRKKIKAKQHKELMTAKQRNEEVEQIDELKKSTLASYTKKAVGDVAKRSDTLGKNLHLALDPNHMDTYGKYYKKTEKRKGMINKAVDKLAKEDVELSAEELERIESIASQLVESKPTIVSAPIRGANQPQSGFGVKNNVADYTISDSKKMRKEEVELEEGRGRPKKSGGEAEGDDTHKHPIQQLTKISHAIEGSEPHFEHKDGAKTKVGKHLAKHVMAVYGSMRTSQEKDDFANKLHASKDSMKSAVSKLF